MKPIAVIAPQHRYSLPKPAALAHIRKHAREIYATCQPREDWSPPPPPAPPDGPPIESRLMVRQTFSAIPAENRMECGRCSLIFDDKGQVQVELEKPALSLIA